MHGRALSVPAVMAVCSLLMASPAWAETITLDLRGTS